MKRYTVLAVLLLAVPAPLYAQWGDLTSLGSGLIESTTGIKASQVETAVKATKKVAKAVEGLTPEQEYYLGRAVSAQILSKYPPYQTTSVNSYVEKVGRVLAAYSDKPETFGGYHFQILDTEEVNAFAAPGGFIFITRGLLRLMPDEDALAGVLAHEIAHVVKGHGTSAISQKNLSEAALMVGGEVAAARGNANVKALTSALGDSVNDVVGTLMEKGYSRGQEYESDEYAVRLLKKAGYDPSGLLTMLHELRKAELRGGGGMFSTHPSAKDREDNIEDEVDASPEGRELRATRFKRFSGRF